MKILQIYDHLGQSCGILSVIMNWYRNMDRNDIQFDFLVGYKSAPSYEEEICALGGRVYYMSQADSLSLTGMPGLIRNVKRFMRDHAKDYDAVHLHTTTFAYPYLHYAKKYGVSHRISHAHSISLGNSKLSALRNKLMILPLKSTANVFLACSSAAGACLYKPLSIQNYDVILNGVDFDRYAYDPDKRDRVRKALGLQEDTLLVAHISNMTAIKNVPFVLETFAKTKEKNANSCLLLVGKNTLPTDVTALIEEYKLEDAILNVGVRSDVPELLQAVDVCLMPSKTEGLGLVAVECQAAGVPVVTSPGFPEDIYVTDRACQMKLEIDAWVDAVLGMVSMRTDPVNLAVAAQKYDVQMIARTITEYYQRIVGV